MADRTQKSPERMGSAARPAERRPLESFLIDAVSAVDQLAGMAGEPENVAGDMPAGFGLPRRPVPLSFQDTQMGYEVRLPFSLKIFFKGGSRIYGIYLPSGSLNVDGADIDDFGLADDVADADDWYEVTGASPGSDVYLNISKSQSGGSEADYEAEVSTSAKSGAKWSFVVAHILSTGGILQRVNGTLALGTGGSGISLKGDTASSVKTDGDVDVTGTGIASGATSCGIEFTTTASVPPRPPPIEGADPVPGVNAKLIADIVGRISGCAHNGETGPRAWACRTLTYLAAPEEPGGQPVLKQVHFLGCEDVSIPGSGGGGATGTIRYIGNIGYNIQTHAFQKRVDEYDLATGQVTEGQWVTIINGQCIAHSSVDHSSVIPSS